MPTIRNRYYPLQIVAEQDVLPFWAKDVTGIAGELVKAVTGSCNPELTDGWTTQAVGAAISNVYSFRPEVKWKATVTVSGDTNFAALGFTEYSTLEFDENGNPLKYNDRRAREIGAVRSGESPNIIQKGVIGLWGNYIDSSLGFPQPGALAVISRSGNGLVGAIMPTHAQFTTTGVPSTTAAYTYTRDQVIGKWLCTLPAATNTGLATPWAAQGGYALMSFNLTK